MSRELAMSFSDKWLPEQVVLFDNNAFSKAALLHIVSTVYPRVPVNDVHCLNMAIDVCQTAYRLERKVLLVVDFSGDLNAPFIFFNRLARWFEKDERPYLKICLYTSVEDPLFINALGALNLAGVIFKREPLSALRDMLHSFGKKAPPGFSRAVREVVDGYDMPPLSYKELQCYFSMIGEQALHFNALRVKCPYKTFASRKYFTLFKAGLTRAKAYRKHMAYLMRQLSK